MSVFRISLLLVLFSADSFGKLYRGYCIYEVVPETEKQVQDLYEFSKTYRKFDFLSEIGLLNATVRVIVPPQNEQLFEDRLTMEAGIYNYRVVNTNLHATITRQISPDPRGCTTLLSCSKFNVYKYNRHRDINLYLDKLAKKYPKRVKVETIGYSFNNLSINAITIKRGIGNSKKTVFIDAGIHAREWLSHATALYIIHQITEKFYENKDLMKYNWVIVPVANPDGYEYSHKKDRRWRKTRQPTKNERCIGVDVNRNFNYNWEGPLREDEKSECSEIYRGPTPFSEPETRALRRILSRVADTCSIYISLHSYGRIFLLPWTSKWEAPKNYPDIEAVAMAGYYAILKATKKNYRIGSPARVVRKAFGTSMDYAYGELKIPITITMELPSGGQGFDPSLNELPNLLNEAWIGIKAMVRKADNV